MKQGIHPNYVQVKVSCVCGNEFTTGTTKGTDIRTEICAACHPFYTGTQKIVDTEGRVERFMKKFQSAQDVRATRQQQSAASKSATPAADKAESK